MDIAVATERYQRRLRVFRVTAAGLVSLDGDHGIPVMEGEDGDARMPMGIALYRRARDGAIFVVVAPKTGQTTSYLWQYRLDVDAASGLVRGALVRRFGNFSGTSEIETVAVDDALGYVYYADEEYAIRKWHADPDHPDAARELAVFAPGHPHIHDPVAAVWRTSGDSTDGIEISPSRLTGDCANGLLAMMNSRDRNFQLYRWEDIARRLGP